MKKYKGFLASILSLQIAVLPLLGFVTTVNSNIYAQTQDSRTTLMRGFRTGYSDGYMAGYKDSIEKRMRTVQNLREYQKADRAYTASFGSLEDYRDGFRQGFEKGYVTGFERKTFDSSIPPDLARRGTINSAMPNNSPQTGGNTHNAVPTQPTQNNSGFPTGIGDRLVIIPAETEFVVKLVSDISTDTAKEGDRFQAKVISPVELEGSIIDGKVTQVRKPGRVSRRAELQLQFDRIQISETRWANYSATLVEVIKTEGNNVKDVDIEGGVRGKSTVKNDAITVGGATAAGAGIGAIAGGPVGAGVGAGIGAAFGLGTVLVSRGKQIKLGKDQQLRLRTSYETQIR